MFSKQLADLLASAGSVAELAKGLVTRLGNCAQPLDHRGPVSVSIVGQDNATNAAVTATNVATKPGTPDGSQGYAVSVPQGITRLDGPIWPLFRPNWIKFVLLQPLLAVPGDEANAQVVAQQPQHDELENDLLGTTVTITNEIGYWSGGIGDAGEANIWYTDLKNDEYEWRPRVIKASGSSATVEDDADATCAEASCKPYFFTLGPIAGLGSGGTCEELNGKTLLLTYSSDCVWKIDGLALGGTCGFDEVRLTVTDSGANKLLTLTFYNASNVLQATATATVAAPTTVDLCADTWADADFSWTTAGPPPAVTGPPTMTLTPYVPPYQSDSTCTCCPDDKIPNSYTVTISGAANSACDGCASWNTTFNLTRDTRFSCWYTGQFNISSGTTPCGSAPNWLEWMGFYPCLGSLSIYGRDTLGSQHANASFTVPASCWDYFNEPDTGITTLTAACDLSSATITISANF